MPENAGELELGPQEVSVSCVEGDPVVEPGSRFTAPGAFDVDCPVTVAEHLPGELEVRVRALRALCHGSIPGKIPRIEQMCSEFNLHDVRQGSRLRGEWKKMSCLC